MRDSIPDYLGPEKRAQVNAMLSEIDRLERMRERKPGWCGFAAEIRDLKEKIRGLTG